MILSTSHISRHLILSVLIILIFWLFVPYKRRDFRLQNFTQYFTQWKMLLNNNTQHHGYTAARWKDKPHVLIAKFLYSLFHNSNNLLVRNCRAEISPRPVSQDVHLCTTFYLYRLNHVAHTLQILCFCQQLVCFLRR